MKFCKSLQRMMDISDPDWAPYYTNYKMLKKIIKELPHHHPPEQHDAKQKSPSTPPLVSPPSRAPSPVPSARQQSGGEHASESPPPEAVAETPNAAVIASIVTNPVEQNFFRLLHQEVRKVSYFYHKLMDELRIRYSRIQYNVQQLLILEEDEHDTADRPSTYSVYRLLHDDDDDDNNNDESRHPTSARAFDRTTTRTNPPASSSTLTAATSNAANRNRRSRSNNPRRQQNYFLCNQSIYKLYRDLMFLELYSIMALTSFSKILKKHDKVTGYCTKFAFMTQIVLPANFVAAAPPMQPMMEQCMEWYDTITHRWMREQEEEDDASLLFLDMIRRLRTHIPAPQTE